MDAGGKLRGWSADGLVVIGNGFTQNLWELPALEEAGTDFGVIGAELRAFGFHEREAVLSKALEDSLPGLIGECETEDEFADVVHETGGVGHAGVGMLPGQILRERGGNERGQQGVPPELARPDGISGHGRAEVASHAQRGDEAAHFVLAKKYDGLIH